MSESGWRLVVNRATCIGSGMCSSTAPDYFELDSEGTSRPTAEQVGPDEVILDAANSCPVEAISVSDPASGSMIAPAR